MTKRTVGKRKKTNEFFTQEVYNLVGDEYTFMEKYQGSALKIQCRHNICGNEWKVNPSGFLSGRRCPFCNTGGKKRKTTQEYKEEIRNKYGDSYTVLGEYAPNQKILIRHNICGFENYVDPAGFLRKPTCPKCSKRVRKDTDYFKKEIFDKYGEEFTILGEYAGANKKIRVTHNVCNTTYETVPARLLRFGSCMRCAGNFVKTTEEFQRDIDKISQGFLVVGEYTGSIKPVDIMHKECGETFSVTPDGFLSNGCLCLSTTCKRKRNTRRRTTEEFQIEINKIYGEGIYIPQEEYQTNVIKIDILHTACGNIWKSYPSNLLRGHGCLVCFGRYQQTTEDFKRRLHEAVGEEYKLIGKYKKAKEKVTLYHEICQQEIEVTPDSFLNRDVRCTCITESSGEREIRKFLDCASIDYLCEHTFDDCRYKHALLFDFAVFSSNELKFIVEFDGKQHFEAVEFFGGKDSLKETQIRDGIKNQYCIDNDIPLIRIPYWEFDNIEHILFDALVEHGLLECIT